MRLVALVDLEQFDERTCGVDLGAHLARWEFQVSRIMFTDHQSQLHLHKGLAGTETDGIGEHGLCADAVHGRLQDDVAPVFECLPLVRDRRASEHVVQYGLDDGCSDCGPGAQRLLLHLSLLSLREML